MSVEATKAAWAYNARSAGEKMVLLRLANRADEQGVCWPKVDELVKMTGLSKRQVQSVLKWLGDGGVLVTLADAEGGRGRSCLRRIVLPGLEGEIDESLARAFGLRGKGAVRKGAVAERVQFQPEKGAVHDTPNIDRKSREPSESLNAGARGPKLQLVADKPPRRPRSQTVEPVGQQQLLETDEDRNARELCERHADRMAEAEGERKPVKNTDLEAARLLLKRHTVAELEAISAWAVTRPFIVSRATTMSVLKSNFALVRREWFATQQRDQRQAQSNGNGHRPLDKEAARRTRTHERLARAQEARQRGEMA